MKYSTLDAKTHSAHFTRGVLSKDILLNPGDDMILLCQLAPSCTKSSKFQQELAVITKLICQQNESFSSNMTYPKTDRQKRSLTRRDEHNNLTPSSWLFPKHIALQNCLDKNPVWNLHSKPPLEDVSWKGAERGQVNGPTNHPQPHPQWNHPGPVVTREHTKCSGDFCRVDTDFGTTTTTYLYI